MKIDIRTNECLYIEINGWTYYIDDSTDEQIIDKWITGEDVDLEIKGRKIEDAIEDKIRNGE